MKPSFVLSEAARLIEERGHWRGLGAPHKRACAVTAAMQVSGDHDARFEAYRYLSQEVGLEYDGCLDDLFEWNDAQEDPAVVIDALNHAAKRAEEAE